MTGRSPPPLPLVSNRLSPADDRLHQRRFLPCNSLSFRRFCAPQTCGRAPRIRARNPPSAFSFSETCGFDRPRPHVEKSGILLAFSHGCLSGSKATYGAGFRHFRTASRIHAPAVLPWPGPLRGLAEPGPQTQDWVRHGPLKSVSRDQPTLSRAGNRCLLGEKRPGVGRWRPAGSTADSR